MTEGVVAPVADVLHVGSMKIKMSYGLMMDLQRVIPDAENAVTYVLTDSFVRDYIMRRVLTDSKGTVASEADLIKPEDIDLDMEDIAKVLDWAVAHILSFFVKSVLGMRQQASALQVLKGLSPPSTVGLETSAS